MKAIDENRVVGIQWKTGDRMKYQFFLSFTLVIIASLFICCASASKPQESEKYDIYLCSEKSGAREDVYAVSVQSKADKGIYSYSHDRYEGTRSYLMKLEFGSFVKTGNTVIFTPREGEPYQGILTEKGLEMGGKVCELTEESRKN